MLSRVAREFAAEISYHDWSDSPYRLDRAGHQREDESPGKRSEKQLNHEETENVRTNVMWVAAQVLKNFDPNLDLHEFATACGVPRRVTHRSNGAKSGAVTYGIRWVEDGVTAAPPGPPSADRLGRFKIALTSANYIDVGDLVEDGVRTAIAQFVDPKAFPRIFKDRTPVGALREYMAAARGYQIAAGSLIELLSVGCRHGRPEHDRAFADVITVLGEPWRWPSLSVADTVQHTPAGAVRITQSYNERLQSLTYLPATLLLYAGAIAAVDGGNYGAVRALTTDAEVSYSMVRHERVPAILRLGPWDSVPDAADIVALRADLAHGGNPPDDLVQKIVTGSVRHVPFAFSNFLFDALKGRVGRHRYAALFDEAEMLFSMILADLRLHGGGDYVEPWLGRFVETIAESRSFDASPVGRYLGGAVSEGAHWAPLQAGMFGGSAARVAAAVDYLVPEVTKSGLLRGR